MTQFVPVEPIGCYLDYTYCGSKNCNNVCGRKMSQSIKEALDKITYHRVAFSDFCDD